MGVEYNLVSQDAQRALEQFSEEFAAALTQGPVEQWAKTLGHYNQSSALKTTYPVPVSAAGYKEFKGDIKYRDLFEKSISLEPKTWQDGVSALASVIEAPDFIGWVNQPAAMAAAGDSLANEIIAAALEANPKCFDKMDFFDSAHPVNVFDESVGVFENDITGAGTDVTVENLMRAMQNFRDIKAPNGKPLGLRLTHIVAPPSLEGAWRNILEQDTIVQAIGNAFGAVSNRFKNTVTLTIADELSDDSRWYAVSRNKPDALPWIVQDQGAPEEIISDKTSALYQTTLKVGIAYIARGNGGLLLPHCVQRWAGTPAASP